MLEEFARHSTFDIGEGTMFARQNLLERGDMHGVPSGLEPETLGQQAAQPIKRQVLSGLQLLATGQKEIERFVPITPAQKLGTKVEQQVPEIGGSRRKQFLNDPNGIVPPRPRTRGWMCGNDWHRLHITQMRLNRKRSLTISKIPPSDGATRKRAYRFLRKALSIQRVF